MVALHLYATPLTKAAAGSSTRRCSKSMASSGVIHEPVTDSAFPVSASSPATIRARRPHARRGSCRFQGRLRDGVQRCVAQLLRSEHVGEILADLRDGIGRDPSSTTPRQRLAYVVTRR